MACLQDRDMEGAAVPGVEQAAQRAGDVPVGRETWWRIAATRRQPTAYTHSPLSGATLVGAGLEHLEAPPSRISTRQPTCCDE